ncbi:MAG TPA: MFS transporter, partial [Chloroflexi bacterium]|nr:MFS transporter [Chloroflexota bacterium]
VFPLFLASMVVVTIGELIFAPSSTTLAANLAPETMRGRYMGVFGMATGLSFGMAPAVGGLINDNLGPRMVWQIMAVVALLSALGFLAIGRGVFRSAPRSVGSAPTMVTGAPHNPHPPVREEGGSSTEPSSE